MKTDTASLAEDSIYLRNEGRKGLAPVFLLFILGQPGDKIGHEDA